MPRGNIRSNRRSQRVSIETVAREADVSIATVMWTWPSRSGRFAIASKKHFFTSGRTFASNGAETSAHGSPVALVVEGAADGAADSVVDAIGAVLALAIGALALVTGASLADADVVGSGDVGGLVEPPHANHQAPTVTTNSDRRGRVRMPREYRTALHRARI